MYELKLMSGDIIDIPKETALKLVGKIGLVAIDGLGIINLNSVVSVLPKGLARTKEDNNVFKCLDGSIAVKKFGVWVDSYSGANIDLEHYPELIKYNEQSKALDVVN